jgi:hypothetical protein
LGSAPVSSRKTAESSKNDPGRKPLSADFERQKCRAEPMKRCHFSL